MKTQDKARIQRLAHGPKATQEFPQSLIAQHERYGLTEKQWAWVDKLVEEAENPPPPPEPGPDLLGLYVLIGQAAERLKYPKIRLKTSNYTPVVISRAGSRSKYEGALNITDGKPYGENRWFGRVNQDGEFIRSRACTDEVVDLLIKLAENPAKVASEYGRATGNCCFCAKSLTDERSVEVGYGPVCAENFSLPWGGINQEDAA